MTDSIPHKPPSSQNSNQSTVSTADSTPRISYNTLTTSHSPDINDITHSINTLTMNNIYNNGAQQQKQHISPHGSSTTSSNGYNQYSNNDTNTILLVSIINQQLPVSIENLYTIFSVYGTVQRIVTFKKQTYQGLIEYQYLDDAVQAKYSLEGKDMFTQCNTLKLSFSQLKPPLRVRSGDDKARDFTLDPIVPSTTTVPYTESHHTQTTAPRTSYSPQAPNSPYSHFTQSYPSSPYTTSPIQPYQAFAGGYIAPGDTQYHYNGTSAPGSVLLINNIVPDIVDADKLFILFGVYGDVLRVKIMYANQSTALIQFVTPQQASIAQHNLDGIELYGSQLSVTLSKHNEVKLPATHTQPIIKHDSNGQQHTIVLTKDYTNSPAHRFRWQNSKNARHVCAPTNSVHVSNLAANLSETEIYDYFHSDLHPVVNISMFTSNNKTMAFVRYNDVTSAVHALIDTHNTKLQGRYVKVTFSHRVDAQPTYNNVNEQPHQQQYVFDTRYTQNGTQNGYSTQYNGHEQSNGHVHESTLVN